jgi:hypothetical protein
MYLPAEAIGLRVEDDYWAGSIGLECLSCASPTTTPGPARPSRASGGVQVSDTSLQEGKGMHGSVARDGPWVQVEDLEGDDDRRTR